MKVKPTFSSISKQSYQTWGTRRRHPFGWVALGNPRSRSRPTLIYAVVTLLEQKPATE